MAILEVLGVTSATSRPATISADLRPADPFDPTALTLTEMSASTSENWAGFAITTAVSNSLERGIVSIFTGSSGNEVRIASMTARNHSRQDEGFHMFFPIPIPSGTRITAGAGTSGGATVDIQILGYPTSNNPPIAASPTYTVCDCGPFNLENSSVTWGAPAQIDPGATANTKGAWTEISVTGTNAGNNVITGSSLPNSYEWLGTIIADTVNSAQTAQERLVDIGTGAASSEVVIIPDFWCRTTAAETSQPDAPVPYAANIASGTRVSCRGQSTITDAADRLFSVILFGMR